jgi:ferredoxin-NADP reductase
VIDVPALVADATGAEVFCCGPTQLIDAVDAEMARVGRGEHLHIERFGPVTRMTPDRIWPSQSAAMGSPGHTLV